MSVRVKPTKYSAAIAASCVALSMASAAYAAQTCDSRVAREIFQTREYSAMCDCEFVTTRFIGELQRHEDFQLVLDSASNTCSGFLGALTSTVAASVVETGFPGPRGNDDPPAGDPPSNDPPSNDPPADDPPADDPPEDEPPGEDEQEDPPYNGGTPFDDFFQ